MATLAVLGASTAAQILERPEELRDVQLVAHGSTLDEILAQLAGRPVDALLMELEALGEAPAEMVRSLQARTQAQLAIITYEFARKDVVSRLGTVADNVRMLRKPVNLGLLQLNMMNLLDVFRAPSKPPAPAALPPVVAPATSAVKAAALPARRPRYTVEQLGRLQEMRSIIQCECPNHVATLVQSLLAFEAYARNCENRNAADAAVHRMLHDKTVAARAVMEEALAELLAFEKIAV